mgnify:CR=1 FL=1
MNVPDRFELFVLPEGVKKVTITPDPKILNTTTIVVQREDHTLGNALCRQLQFQEHVTFTGYRMPHPLEPAFELKIQTDGSITPVAAAQMGATTIQGQLATLEDRLRTEIKRYKSVGRRI